MATLQPMGLKLKVLHFARWFLASIGRVFMYYGKKGEKLPPITEDFLKQPAVEIARRITGQEIGLHHTSGVVLRKGIIATEDAAAIKLLRNKGAIIVGLTNVPEICGNRTTIFMEGHRILITQRGSRGSLQEAKVVFRPFLAACSVLVSTTD